MTLQGLRAVAHGAWCALRDPRLLARLATPTPAEREAIHRRDALAFLGEVPRTIPLDQLLTSAGCRIPAYAFLDDASSVPDLVLLRSLITRYGGRRFFEIGTFRGESAAAVADTGATVVTLALPDAEQLRRGTDPDFVAAHRAVSGDVSRVTHLQGDSRTVDLAPWQGWADVVFIDGSHERADVANDTRRCWGLRAGPRVPVVWHDGFSTPLQPRWEVLAGIAEALPPEYRSGLVHVSNTLAVAWLPDAQELPSVPRSYVPRALYEVEISLVGDGQAGVAPGDRPIGTERAHA